MNGMKISSKAAPLMAAACVALASASAVVPADAAQITVIRGSESTVVDTNAPHKGPLVLRGGMGRETEKKTTVEKRTVIVSPRSSGTLGTGSTIWLRTDRGIVACWLRGTGYVGESRIVCSGN